MRSWQSEARASSDMLFTASDGTPGDDCPSSPLRSWILATARAGSDIFGPPLARVAHHAVAPPKVRSDARTAAFRMLAFGPIVPGLLHVRAVVEENRERDGPVSSLRIVRI